MNARVLHPEQYSASLVAATRGPDQIIVCFIPLVVKFQHSSEELQRRGSIQIAFSPKSHSIRTVGTQGAGAIIRVAC